MTRFLLIIIFTGLPLPPPPQDSKQLLCVCCVYRRFVQLLFGTLKLSCGTLLFSGPRVVYGPQWPPPRWWVWSVKKRAGYKLAIWRLDRACHRGWCMCIYPLQVQFTRCRCHIQDILCMFYTVNAFIYYSHDNRWGTVHDTAWVCQWLLKRPLATWNWNTLLVYSSYRHGRCKQLNNSNSTWLIN